LVVRRPRQVGDLAQGMQLAAKGGHLPCVANYVRQLAQRRVVEVIQ
jgi:hypothetical protein